MMLMLIWGQNMKKGRLKHIQIRSLQKWAVQPLIFDYNNCTSLAKLSPLWNLFQLTWVPCFLKKRASLGKTTRWGKTIESAPFSMIRNISRRILKPPDGVFIVSKSDVWNWHTADLVHRTGQILPGNRILLVNIEKVFYSKQNGNYKVFMNFEHISCETCT